MDDELISRLLYFDAARQRSLAHPFGPLDGHVAPAERNLHTHQWHWTLPNTGLFDFFRHIYTHSSSPNTDERSSNLVNRAEQLATDVARFRDSTADDAFARRENRKTESA